jgi:hypothetical protein
MQWQNGPLQFESDVAFLSKLGGQASLVAALAKKTQRGGFADRRWHRGGHPLRHWRL